MAEVTMKSTKQEIMDELNRTREMLDNRTEVMDVGIKEQNAAAEKKVIETAENDVKFGIFSDAMNAKYTNLTQAIALLEKRLSDGYGIEKELQDMVTVVTASKEARIRMEKEYSERSAAIEDSIKKLRDEYNEVLAALREKDKQLREDLEKERDRENEEYLYERDRSRKIEQDKYDDRMAELKKELADAEKLSESINEKAWERADEIRSMEEQIAEFPERLAAECKAAYAEGEHAAGKEYGYKKAMADKEHEFELKDRDARIARLEAEVDEKASKIESLESKLDNAYSQIRDLASKTVESNGSIKVINGSSTESTSRR